MKNWRRWCGARGELVSAVELASDVLASWFRFDAATSVRIEDRQGTTETSTSVDVITALHPSALPHLDSIIVNVKYDSDAWATASHERWERQQQTLPIPSGEVSIRITNYGTTLAGTACARRRASATHRCTSPPATSSAGTP